MTKGEKIIGKFNPTASEYVSEIKNIFINLIDKIDKETGYGDDDHISNEVKKEINRLKETVFSKLEEACMFAIKTKMHFK